MSAEKKPVEAVSDLQAKKSFNTNILLSALAVLLFAIITFAYFSPMISGGEVMNQSDITHFKGMSKELVDYYNATGNRSLWTNSMFGGMPSFTVYTLYNGNLAGMFHSILTLGFPHPSGLLFLSMLSFFILMLSLRLNIWIAIAASIASGLSSFNLIILEAGHNSQMAAIAYMPLVVAGTILAFRKNYILGGIVAAIGLSLEIRAGHVQVTYYLMIMLLILGIIELISAIRKKTISDFIKSSSVLIIAIVFGIITNAGYLLSMQEYSPSSTRGPSELKSNTESTGGTDESYAFDWSYGKMETFTLLIPNFYGGSSHAQISDKSKTAEFLKAQGISGNQLENYLQSMPMYRGDVLFTSGPVYMGAIICFLFVLGLFIIKGNIKWWLLIASIVAIILSWGRNFYFFNHFIFDHLPMYDKFRTVSMNLVTLQITFPLMAALALWAVFKNELEKETLKKALLYSFYITGGICLLFAILGPALFDFVKQTRNNDPGDGRYPDAMRMALIEDRKKLLQTDAFRSLVFIALVFSLIWFYLKQKISMQISLISILAMVFIDQFTVGKRYLDKNDFLPETQYMQAFQQTAADKKILTDKDPNFRVLNYTVDPFQDASTSYYHKSIGGYNAAKMRRFQDVVTNQFSRQDEKGKSLGPNLEVINMLNTKYVIVPDNNKMPVAQLNPNANGNAWFIDNIQWVNNADEEMAALNNLDSKGTAVIDKQFENDLNGFSPEIDSAATIVLKSYAPDKLVYESNSSVNGLAVFSEIYYQPGWKSVIDGKEAPHVRADYLLRAIAIPAGKHTIEFTFHPDTYFKGESISRMSSVLMLILSALGIGFLIWNSRKKKAV